MNKELIAQMREAIDNMDDYARMADIKATGPLAVLSRGAEALELADKRIAEQAEEITMLRYRHLITCGTTHPEMYKTELDHAKERIAELEAERDERPSAADYGELNERFNEAERKLDVAREALNCVVTMPRSAESIRRCTQALAQIGEK